MRHYEKSSISQPQSLPSAFMDSLNSGLQSLTAFFQLLTLDTEVETTKPKMAKCTAMPDIPTITTECVLYHGLLGLLRSASFSRQLVDNYAFLSSSCQCTHLAAM